MPDLSTLHFDPIGGPNSKKFACESCIKGHRTSSCKHTDRPMLEVKKKGRPASQCGHCRELRKTKKVHVKCMCQSQTGSDSCRCEETGTCHCCVPRKNAPSGKQKATQTADDASQQSSSTGPNESQLPFGIDLSDASLVNAPPKRTSELRPILPRPSQVTAGAHCSPSHTATVEESQHQEAHLFDHPLTNLPNSHFTVHPKTAPTWQYPSSQNDSNIFELPGGCKCGDSCGCPACPTHSTPSSQRPLTTERCFTCLDCTLQTLSAVETDPFLSIPETVHESQGSLNLPTAVSPFHSWQAPTTHPPWGDIGGSDSVPGGQQSGMVTTGCSGCGGDTCPCAHCQLGCTTPFDPTSPHPEMMVGQTTDDCASCLDCVLRKLPPDDHGADVDFGVSLPGPGVPNGSMQPSGLVGLGVGQAAAGCCDGSSSVFMGGPVEKELNLLASGSAGFDATISGSMAGWLGLENSGEGFLKDFDVDPSLRLS